MVTQLSKYELLKILVNFTNITIKQLSELYNLSPYKLRPHIKTVLVDKNNKSNKNILDDNELIETICNSLSLSKEQVIEILTPKKKFYIYLIKDIENNTYLDYSNTYSVLSETTFKFKSKSEAQSKVDKHNPNIKIVKFEFKEV